MVKQSFSFRPSARLQRFLGTELIADPNVAVIEFIKNAYDAGAAKVVVQFTIAKDPTRLLIADNGVGMNETSFEQNWMHPGYSEKAGGEQPRTRFRSPAHERQSKRLPVGEKGIGRLAAGRLGENLEVFTRIRERDPWLHVQFDWKRFDNMSIPLDKVPVPYDFDTSPPVDAPFETGTIIMIQELTQDWSQRVRGRAVRGRRTTRMGRLKQDLEFLVRPLTPTHADFNISLDSDVVLHRQDVGNISPKAAVRAAHYSYEFKFRRDKAGRTVITRIIRRSADAAGAAGKPERDPNLTVVVSAEVAKSEGRPEELTCGPFRGTFLYNPPHAARRARAIEKSPVGVLLYRDGLLVEPYGIDDNDWLGVRARKAQRQGHAAIQPDTFSGFTLISRRENPDLRDMSNRLGLLETQESENFLDQVRAEFYQFERLLESELVDPRVADSRAEEAQEKAEESQRLAAIMLRALAHSLRQPLQGLGWELITLEAVESDDDVPDHARKTLKEVRQALESHLDRIESRVSDLINLKTPEFAEVGIDELVSQAVTQLSHVARSRQATLQIVAKEPRRKVLVPRDLVVQSVATLIQNGLEAERPDGRSASVEIGAYWETGDVRIDVTDNGSGITKYRPRLPLHELPSTKGRPAVGLANAEVAIAAARGRLEVVSTGAEGTTFRIWLPTRVGGLKS